MTGKSAAERTSVSTRRPVKAQRQQAPPQEVETPDVVNLLQKTRVATIAVSTVAMLFCALFWPSVLDFRAKLHRGGVPVAPAKPLRIAEDVVETPELEDDDWDERLAALYPHDEFFAPETAVSPSDSTLDVQSRMSLFDPYRSDNSDAFVSDAPIADAYDDVEEGVLAASDALFDDDPLPPAPYAFYDRADALDATSDPLFTDDARLDSAELFHEDAVATPDASFFDVPRVARAPVESEPFVDDLSASPENPLLADLPSVDPNDPLGLGVTPDDEFPEPVATPAAPKATLSAGAPQPEQRTGVASTSYETLADRAATIDAVSPDSDPDADLLVAAPVTGRSFAYASDVPVESQENAVQAEDSFPSVTAADADSEAPVAATEPLYYGDAVADFESSLAPSYFSRAAGLWGGQSAFSGLYFARAAALVSSDSAWSPDSLSRITPVAAPGATSPSDVTPNLGTTETSPAPDASLSEATLEEVESDVDDATAAEMHARYPTLVGYVERKTLPAPAPLARADESDVVSPQATTTPIPTR